MALKDWKLIQNNSIYKEYKNYSLDNIIVVSKNVFESLPNFKGWRYHLYAGKTQITKQFKTKLQALSFAKEYMKSN